MGLDDFTQDDSSTDTTSESTTTSKDTSTPDNTPYYSEQRFGDHNDVTPRRIKFQIKGVGRSWIKQFTTERFDSGEVILYGAGDRAKESGKTVLVYTTITPVIDNVSTEENKDIRVVCYDLDENKEITDGENIEYTPDWHNDLYDAVRRQMNNLQDILN